MDYLDINQEPSDEIKALINRIEEYKAGKTTRYPDEDEFDMVADHYLQVLKNYKALEVIELGLTIHPFSTVLMLGKANLLIILNRFEESLDILDAVELYSPSDIDVCILRVEALLALGRVEDANQIYIECQEAFTGDEKLELLFEIADVFDDYQLPEKSFDCIKQILEAEPANEEALYKICFFADISGLFAESIELHQKIIEEQPYNELAWFNLGTAYQGLGLHEKAVDAYQYSIAINEKFDIAYRNLADAFIRIRNFEDALDAIETAVSFNKGDSHLYNAMAHCYIKLGNNIKARNCYRKSMGLSPDYDTQLRIGKSYMADKAWKFAVRELQAAQQLNPKKPEVYVALGICYRNLRDFDNAIKSIEFATSKNPRNQNTWIEYLQTLYDAKMFGLGLSVAERANAATGGKPVFSYYTAMFLFALKKPKLGLSTLQEALLANPKQATQISKIDEKILQNSDVMKLLSQFHKPKPKQRRKK